MANQAFADYLDDFEKDNVRYVKKIKVISEEELTEPLKISYGPGPCSECATVVIRDGLNNYYWGFSREVDNLHGEVFVYLEYTDQSEIIRPYFHEKTRPILDLSNVKLTKGPVDIEALNKKHEAAVMRANQDNHGFLPNTVNSGMSQISHDKSQVVKDQSKSIWSYFVPPDPEKDPDFIPIAIATFVLFMIMRSWIGPKKSTNSIHDDDMD